MSDLIELARFGATGIAILLIGAILIIVKYFISFLKCREKNHERMYRDFRKSLDKNTKVTNEMYHFLKMKNGGK